MVRVRMHRKMIVRHPPAFAGPAWLPALHALCVMADVAGTTCARSGASWAVTNCERCKLAAVGALRGNVAVLL